MKLANAIDGRAVIRFSSGLEIRVAHILTGAGFLTFALIISIISSAYGETDTNFVNVFLSLFDELDNKDQLYAIWEVRLPRITLGFMAGWCVALSGTLLQSIARNPLADPGLLGVNQGAMTVTVLMLAVVPGASQFLFTAGAMAGSLTVAGVLIWLVRGEHSNGLAVLLMGIAIETVLSSVSSVLILYTSSDTSYSLARWLAGSLFQASWHLISVFTPLFLLSLAGIVVLGRRLSTFDLGNEVAMTLGEPVAFSRPAILIFAVLLSASAVTAVGPLMFLGVLSPHLATLICPATGRARLFLSGLMGGILVIVADAITRSLISDIPLPVGLSLSLIGVPLLIIGLRIQALRKAHIY